MRRASTRVEDGPESGRAPVEVRRASTRVEDGPESGRAPVEVRRPQVPADDGWWWLAFLGRSGFAAGPGSGFAAGPGNKTYFLAPSAERGRWTWDDSPLDAAATTSRLS